jgi:uroporphyrinogen-III synthase
VTPADVCNDPGNSRGRILVTRSEPGAGQLVDALIGAGFAAIALPALDIEAVSEPPNRHALQQLDRFALAIFVSIHAVEFGMPMIEAVWSAAPRGPTWVAVGDATAAALARRGIIALVPAEQSSDGILALPQTAAVAGRRVLIVAGEGGRPDLQQALIRRGAMVERLAVYRRVPRRGCSELAGLRDHLAAVVISSADGGRAFAAQWAAAGGNREIPLIVPSARVADAMRKQHFSAIVTSTGAGAAAVIDALRSIVKD